MIIARQGGYDSLQQGVSNHHPALRQKRTQSVREMVTQKHKRHEELLTDMMSQRRAVVNDHLSGRESLDDEVSTRNQNEFALFPLPLLFAYQYFLPWTLILLPLNTPPPARTCA